MLALFLRRDAERVVPDSLRISGSHNMFDDSALACGVHALQHEKQRLVVAGTLAVGVEHLLQFGESRVALRLHLGGVGLLTLETRCRAGFDVGDLVAVAIHQKVVWFVCPRLGQILGFAHRLSNCGGRIGDGCAISLNFAREPPTSTMPHSAFHDSIVR